MIPVAEPNLGPSEQLAVQAAVASGWVSGGGDRVAEFEERVAKISERKWCVAVLTGSLAIEIALHAEQVGKGHYCAMPSLTFCAGANALIRRGAAPMFLDRTPTWTPDATEIGPVLDLAPAIGASLKSDGLVTLSFNGNKTITTGQGGAILGDDPEMEKRVRHLCSVAKVHDYEVDDIGHNAVMPNLNAALGCAQLGRLDEFIEAKQTIMHKYRRAGLPLVPSQWMAVVDFNRVSSTAHDARRNPSAIAIHTLREAGIGARPFWKPLHLQAPYENYPRDDLPYTEAIWEHLVCLPCSTHLSHHEQMYVIKTIQEMDL